MIAGLRLLEVVLPMLALTTPPDSMWSTSVGENGREECMAVAENHKHEIIMAGQRLTDARTDLDGWIAMLDETGDQLWFRSNEGLKENGFQYIDVLQNDDILVCGFSRCQGAGQRDGWLQRLDESGEPRFSRTYGGTENDVMKCIVPVSDDAYYVCGNTRSFGAGDADFWLMKINGKGDSLWSKTYGRVFYEDARHMIPVSTGGLLIIGQTCSLGEGPYNGWAVRVNEEGDSLWSHVYGGRSTDQLLASAETQDGNFLLAGYTDSQGAGNTDFWLIRTDSIGETIWERTYGGPGDESCHSMQLSKDGGILLFGETFSFGAGSSDYWLLKVNAEGDSLWSRTFGGSDADEGRCLLTRSDDSNLLSGQSASFSLDKLDSWLVQTSKDSATIRSDDEAQE